MRGAASWATSSPARSPTCARSITTTLLRSGLTGFPEMTDAYADVPYPTAPIRCTHPEILSVVGALSGLRPAPADRCRVLEIGCGDGGNLLPMACGLPGSEFVGIEPSGPA